MCEFWKKKTGIADYEEWYSSHESECISNHTGPSDKMEADALIEMFQHSEETSGVKYVNYIGNGHFKIDAKIVKSSPNKIYRVRL